MVDIARYAFRLSAWNELAGVDDIFILMYYVKNDGTSEIEIASASVVFCCRDRRLLVRAVNSSSNRHLQHQLTSLSPHCCPPSRPPCRSEVEEALLVAHRVPAAQAERHQARCVAFSSSRLTRPFCFRERESRAAVLTSPALPSPRYTLQAATSWCTASSTRSRTTKTRGRAMRSASRSSRESIVP